MRCKEQHIAFGTSKMQIFTVSGALLCIWSLGSTVSALKCSTKDLKGGERSVTVSTKGFAKPCELIFSDDFLEFDLETWSHEITAAGGGNNEFQIYYNNRSNSFVKDGKLFIKPTLTADKYGESFLTSGTLDLNDGTPATQCTNNRDKGCFRVGSDQSIIPPVMSARIRSVNSFAFKYGTIVIRAKLPLGDWLWPAIWLLPQSNHYGGWPASGEIDVMESRGNRKLTTTEGKEIGVEQFGGTLHYGPHWPLNGFRKTHVEHNTKPDNGLHKEFHDYELEWRPDGFTFRLDGNLVGNITPPKGGFWELGGFSDNNVDNPWKYSKTPLMAPFDQKFYIVFNLAVGGTQGYFPDSTSNPHRPWENHKSQGQASLQFWNAKDEWYPTWNNSEFVIDYVKVYASEIVDKMPIMGPTTSTVGPQKNPSAAKSKSKNLSTAMLPTMSFDIYVFNYFFWFSIFRYFDL